MHTEPATDTRNRTPARGAVSAAVLGTAIVAFAILIGAVIWLGMGKKTDSAAEKARAFAEASGDAGGKRPEPKPINVEAVATDTAARDAALFMDYSEFVQRLGAHTLKQDVDVLIKSPLREFRMVEHNLIEHTGRDYRFVSDGGDDRGAEIFMIKNFFYTGGKGGPYEARGQQPRLGRMRQNAAYAPMPRLLSEFKPWLVLRRAGSSTIASRAAALYNVSLDRQKLPEPPTFPDVDKETAVSLAKQAAAEFRSALRSGKRDGTTARVPINLEGQIAIDKTHGTILQAKLSGESIAQSKLPTRITFTVTHEVTAVGTPTEIKVPTVTPIERAPKHDAAPIEFFDKNTAKKQRSLTEGATAPAEPEEE